MKEFFVLRPMTSKQILENSFGEVYNPKYMPAARAHPTPGGLLSQEIFGPQIDYRCRCGNLAGIADSGKTCNACGVDCVSSVCRSTRFGHISLPYPVINPIFYKALGELLSLKKVRVEKIAKNLDPKMTPLELYDFAKDGASPSTSNSLEPLDLYLEYLPVLPPYARDSELFHRDMPGVLINRLYIKIIETRNRLERLLFRGGSKFLVNKEVGILQLLLHQLFLGGAKDRSGEDTTGLIGRLAGKHGSFRRAMLGKSIDFSARAVIIPNPQLGIGEVGIPIQIGLKLFEPFVVRYLLKTNQADSFEKALEMVTAQTVEAWTALEQIAQTRRVLLNRQPTLHQYNILSFGVRLITGSAVQIHPLTCLPFDADFDGDAITVYAILSKEGMQESYEISPERQRTDLQTGRLNFVPSHEILLGMRLAARTSEGLTRLRQLTGHPIDAEITKDSLDQICRKMSLEKLQELTSYCLAMATASGTSIAYHDFKDGSLLKEWASAGLRVKPEQLAHIDKITKGQNTHEFWQNAEDVIRTKSLFSKQIGEVTWLLRRLLICSWDIRIEEPCGSKDGNILTCRSMEGICLDCYPVAREIGDAVGIQACYSATTQIAEKIFGSIHVPGQRLQVALFRQLFDFCGKFSYIKGVLKEKQCLESTFQVFYEEAVELYSGIKIDISETHLRVLFRLVSSYATKDGLLVRWTPGMDLELTGSLSLARKVPDWTKRIALGWISSALNDAVGNNLQTEKGKSFGNLFFGDYHGRRYG